MGRSVKRREGGGGLFSIAHRGIVLFFAEQFASSDIVFTTGDQEEGGGAGLSIAAHGEVILIDNTNIHLSSTP